MAMTEEQSRQVQFYLNALSPELVLSGLRFAYNRQMAAEGGYLMPGRKSLVKRETHMLSQDQARWRLNNWKAMIRAYREKGYSYPTISRIKQEIKKVAARKTHAA
jgi:hypothetical protein